MLFSWKIMCALLVIQLKPSEVLQYTSHAVRLKASFIIMWLMFQVLIAFPICFTQFLLGQYGKRAMIRCWEMSPVISGMGYSMLLMALLYMTYESQLGIVAIEYVIISLRHHPLPWCECNYQTIDLEHCIQKKISMSSSFSRSSSYRGDWNTSLRHNLTEPVNLRDASISEWRVGPSETKVSAYHYFVNHETDPSLSDKLERLAIAVLFWIAVSSVQALKFTKLTTFVAIGLVLIVGLALAGHVFVYVMFDMGDAIEDQSTMVPRVFIEIQAWTHAAFTATGTLISGTGYMIFFGTFLRGKARPDLNAALLCVVKMVFCIFVSLFFFSIFLKQMDIHEIEDTQVITGHDDIDFGVPLILAFLCDTIRPSIFSISVFIVLALIQYIVVCLEMSILVKCLDESFTKLHRYRVYVVVGAGLLMLSLELAKFGNNNLDIMRLLFKLKIACTAILMILYTFFVHILYGPSRLSSDMELIVKTKTPPIWIFLWVFCFVLTVASIPNIDTSLKETVKINIMLWIILIIIIFPIIIIGIILYFRYLKHHVLFNLIRPTENWKPQDYDETKFEMFDYRKEVMFKIPYKVCEHPCIQEVKELDKEIAENMKRSDKLLGEGEGGDEETEEGEGEGEREGRESVDTTLDIFR